jgi:macrolide-specific efflux system membrane fusion protein
VPNEDNRLRALMTAKVSIVLDRRANALTIPATALGAKGKDGRYTVRVKTEEGAIENRQVKVGLNNNVNVEVLSGLKEGEAVVIGEASAATASSGGRRRMGPPGF